MEILPTYVISSVVASLGLLAGFLLGRFVEEELEQGDKYFLWLKYILAVLIFGLILFYSRNMYFFLIALLFFFILHVHEKNYLITCEYTLLGVMFYFAWQYEAVLVAVLIFLYGLPSGTRFYFHKRKWLDVFLAMAFFFLVSLGLLMV